MRTMFSPSRCGVATAFLTCLLGLSATLQAQNPPWPPLVFVLGLDPEAAEEYSDTATFLVVRAGPANTPLTVSYQVGGSAANGTDYDLLPGAVTIPEGAWFAPVTVTPMDDFAVEGTESVVIALQQPPVWPPPYLVSWPAVATAGIVDNDVAPTNKPPSVEIVRPPNGAVFEYGEDIAIVARAFDHDGRVHTVEFFDGSHSLGIVTNRPIFPMSTTAIALDSDPSFDLDAELFPDFDATPGLKSMPGQYFRFIWSNASPGLHVLTAVATDNAGGTRRSDPVEIAVLECPPRPVVTVRASDPVASEPNPATDYLDTATFRIHRTGPTNHALPVYYRLAGTASNGVDYAQLPLQAVVPAGQRSVNVVVEPMDDALVEGLESVHLVLEEPACIAVFPPPPDCYIVGRPGAARAVIRDNDVPPNFPPAVRLVRPLDGEVFVAPAEIRLAALARDFDGYVKSVEFFEGTNSLGVVTNDPAAISPTCPPFTLVWSNVPPGRYVLTAVATDNDGAETPSCPVEIKVVPLVPLPVVNIEPIDPEAAETGPLTVIDTAIFSVTRTGPTNHPLRVFYRVGGTASNGVDYFWLTGQVEIPGGSTSNRIVVSPIEDPFMEGTETVILKLELPPTLTPANLSLLPWYRIGSNDVARAIIRDNDFNQSPKVEIVHPSDGDWFRAGADIGIDVAACDPDGWVSNVKFYANGELIGEQSIYFILPPPPGQPQKFSMVWSNVAAGEYALTAVGTDDQGGMSRSDPVRIKVTPLPDLPVVTIWAVDPVGSEPDLLSLAPPDTALFKVTRTGDFSTSLTVQYRVSGTALNGVDYHGLTGKVTIPVNEASAPVEVTPIDDNLVEGTESVVLTLVQPPWLTNDTATAGGYLVGRPGRAIAYIRDNDAPNQPPTVAIISPPNGAVFAPPTDVRLVAAAADLDGWVTTVEFFDGTTSLGVVSNEFIILDDTPVRLPELGADVLTESSPLKPFSMVWSNVPPGRHVITALATDNAGDTCRSRPVEITVLEPSHPPVVTIMTVDAIAREGAVNPAVFRVRRVGPTNAPLAVHYSVRGTASNGVDYVLLPGSVTIPAGKRSQRLVVEPLNDNLNERIETVLLRLTLPPAGSETYVLGRPVWGAALILDNDCTLDAPECLPDGSLHLRLEVATGVRYRVEASTNLVDWETEASLTAETELHSIVAAERGEHPQRFFRVVPEFGDFDADE